MKKVALIYRAPSESRFSIERVFRPLEPLPVTKRLELPCDLNSLKNLFKLIVFAIGIKEKYLHITGDVHFMAFLAFWKRSIVTVHDCNRYEELSGLRKFIMGLIWFSLPLRKASRIITISPYSAEQLLGNFNLKKKKIAVIPNSISLLPNKNAAKSTLSSGEGFAILAVGTKPNKNLYRLVDALKGLNGINLTIIGRISTALKSKIQESQVSFENAFNLNDSELKTYYQKSDLLFFASLKEGFGLPILEAQVAGTPVITSNTTSMPYVAGKSACIVDPTDIQMIQDAILKIKNDEDYRNNLVRSGLKNVERFQEHHFIEKYTQIYREEFNL